MGSTVVSCVVVSNGWVGGRSRGWEVLLLAVWWLITAGLEVEAEGGKYCC
jgi:hypothetical protein